MFSINPMYDFGQGDYALGSTGERQTLYRRCEKEGVGISVMKPFNAGQLLDAAKSPFHQALTPAQCLQYALDKPRCAHSCRRPRKCRAAEGNLKFLGYYRGGT